MAVSAIGTFVKFMPMLGMVLTRRSHWYALAELTVPRRQV
jgi:hypothetical protein